MGLFLRSSSEAVSSSDRLSDVTDAVSSAFSQMQQKSSNGRALRVNVCEWNKGEQANKALTALWSNMFLFGSGRRSRESAESDYNLTLQKYAQQTTDRLSF